MKTIIAGSRDILDIQQVRIAHNLSKFTISLVISGGARGVDELGEAYAVEIGTPCVLFPVRADEWKRSRGAGFARNARMAEYADQLLAVWDGKSPGTANMIERMKTLGKPAYVHICPCPVAGREER